MKVIWWLPSLVAVLASCQPAAKDAPAPSSAASADSIQLLKTLPDDSIPDGVLGASIRRGRALLTATGDSLPDHVGNALRCTSCHLDAGTRARSAPWVGVYSRFPQYRSRNAKINLIEERINNCFERSMNGTALPREGRDLADMVAYYAFLSRGIPPPGEVDGQGFVRMSPLEADSARGHRIYVAQCARCHGGNGEGMANPDPAGVPAFYPPLWGPRSFNVGAGMARVRTAASFIRYNMPFDRPGTLTDQEAFDVARYMTLQPRLDFRGKEADWPLGDAPPDVAYRTRAAKKDPGPFPPLLPAPAPDG